MQSSLLILGASARAAAQSAHRAGFRVFAGDLFGDRELVACAVQCRTTDDFPAGLATLANDFPSMNWMYTGGLENHGALVDRISSRHKLLGNPGHVLAQVRDPFRLASTWAAAGLPHLPVCSLVAQIPAGGAWLRKPLRGSAGYGIERVAFPTSDQAHCYYQRFQAGPAYAGVFLGNGREALLLGITRQLVGTQWHAPMPFGYAGSVGPAALEPACERAFETLGRIAVARFDLRGLFGIDAIVAEQQVWPVELNPRFPASVEILERAYGFNAVSLHAAACAGNLPQVFAREYAAVHGKAIVWARAPFVVSAEFVSQCERDNQKAQQPLWADLPQPNTPFRAGDPVLTRFCQAHSETQALEQLHAAVVWESFTGYS